MNIFQLRHRLAFYQATPHLDSESPETVWTKLWDVWGDLEPLNVSSSENMSAAVSQNATHRLMLRYDPNKIVRTGYRVVFDDRAFLVCRTVLPGEQKDIVSVLLQEDLSFQASTR